MLLRKDSLLGKTENVFCLRPPHNIQTCLCYKESNVGCVYMLLRENFRGIKFYQKDLIRSRVFIRTVLKCTKFKSVRKQCVSLNRANV